MARFAGFYAPRYTQVPDQLFDELLPALSGAELKALLYIIRRTFGFKKDSDNISLSQLLTGITTKDGRVLDRGTGLTKKTLLAALASLEEGGYIVRERRQSEDRGHEATTFRLRFEGEEIITLPLGEKLHLGLGEETTPSPRGKNYAIQETVLQETGETTETKTEIDSTTWRLIQLGVPTHLHDQVREQMKK